MHRPWLRCWRRWVASGSFWKRQGVRRGLSPGAFRRQLGPAHASVLAHEPVSDLPAPEPCGGNGCCGELLSEWQCAAAAMVHKYTLFHTFQSPGGTLSTGPGSAAGHSATSDFPVWCRKVITNVDQVFSPDAGPERCLAVCALPPWARAAWQRPTEGRRPAPPERPGQALLVWAAKLFC